MESIFGVLGKVLGESHHGLERKGRMARSRQKPRRTSASGFFGHRQRRAREPERARDRVRRSFVEGRKVDANCTIRGGLCRGYECGAEWRGRAFAQRASVGIEGGVNFVWGIVEPIEQDERGHVRWSFTQRGKRSVPQGRHELAGRRGIDLGKRMETRRSPRELRPDERFAQEVALSHSGVGRHIDDSARREEGRKLCFPSNRTWDRGRNERAGVAPHGRGAAEGFERVLGRVGSSRRIVVREPVQQIGDGGLDPGEGTVEAFAHRGAECKKVRRGGFGRPSQELWRGILSCQPRRFGSVRRSGEWERTPKIEQHGPRIRGGRDGPEAHVARLEIAVQKARAVEHSDGDEEIGQTRGEGGIRSCWCLTCEPDDVGKDLPQILPDDELLDEKRRLGSHVEREVVCDGEARRSDTSEQSKLGARFFLERTTRRP
jgi:hypothetical protein